MITKNLIGFVKIAIISNPNLDDDSVNVLTKFVADMQTRLDDKDALIVKLSVLLSNNGKD